MLAAMHTVNASIDVWEDELLLIRSAIAKLTFLADKRFITTNQSFMAFIVLLIVKSNKPIL